MVIIREEERDSVRGDLGIELVERGIAHDVVVGDLLVVLISDEVELRNVLLNLLVGVVVRTSCELKGLATTNWQLLLVLRHTVTLRQSLGRRIAP